MERTEILEQLFRRHYARMLRVARTILGDEQESKDVVSDIFVALLSGRTTMMPGTEERYLLTSVRNQCLKRLRHECVKRQMADQVMTVTASDDPNADDERLADIDEFVAGSLSEQECRIFHMRFTDGCTYEEIAAAEGISRVAVWKHLSHALNLIKNHFKKQ